MKSAILYIHGSNSNIISFLKIPALDEHKIELLEEVDIEFFDNNGTYISCEDLFDIVGQKINCGCFWVELKFIGENTPTTTSEVRIERSNVY